jgi:hypothetical protein
MKTDLGTEEELRHSDEVFIQRSKLSWILVKIVFTKSRRHDARRDHATRELSSDEIWLDATPEIGRERKEKERN